MNPVTFSENNTSFLNIETGVVLVLFVMLLIAGTVHNISIHKYDNRFIQTSVILQTVLSIIAVLFFLGYTNHIASQENDVEKIMVQQIQENYNVKNLTVIDDLEIYCNKEYSGNISAVVWSEDSSQQTGLLIGERKGNECRFILEETIRKDVLQGLKTPE